MMYLNELIAQLPILSITIALPAMGALFLLLFTCNKNGSACFIRSFSLGISILTFILSLIIYQSFDVTNSSYQLKEIYPWIEAWNINYHVAIDGIAIYLILLTTFLTPICILASKESINNRVKEYFIAFLLLESLIIGVFCAVDIMLFFVFFEAMLIPMFLIIGIWGGTNRIYAAYKFFLYTLAGSIFLLLAIIYLYLNVGSMDIPTLVAEAPKLSLSVQKWLWLALFVSFAVKIPMWPVHTWLPDAHVQAPTAGSVILAGVLLKMGAYGLIRFSLPMLPEASIYYSEFVFCLSVIAIIYASLVAFAQQDMKKLIAYSSIAHMGYVTLGIFTFNMQGIEGALVQMISHGLVSAALFLMVGVLYDRMHTREIARYGGVTNKMPVFAAISMVFTMASVGLPGTSGFVGELLVLVGAFKANKLYSVLAATGLILGAVYMLWLYRKIFFGEINNDEVANLSDLNKRELTIFIPLLILVIILGIYPKVITQGLHLPVAKIIKPLNKSDKNELR